MWFVDDAFWANKSKGFVPMKLEKLKIEYEKKEIVIKHNFNNSGEIVLENLHNLNPLVRH